MRCLLALLLGCSASATAGEVRLMTLEPGHFHAALVQKQMPPGVDETVPTRAGDHAALRSALERKVTALASARPGLAVADEGERLRIVTPDRYRVGHEAHLALRASSGSRGC